MILKQIDDAVRNGLTIEIRYTKYGGETSVRTISDIHYSEEYGPSYIEGFCHIRNEKRTFKISRITNVAVVRQDLPEEGTSNLSDVKMNYVFNPKKRVFNLYET